MSPQILLLAVAMVMSAKLDLKHIVWTWEGFKTALPFFAIMLTVLGAMAANTSTFIQKASSAPARMRRVVRLIERIFKDKPIRQLLALLWAVWKHNKLGAVQIILAIAIADIGFATEFVSAFPAAGTLLRAFSGK